MSEENPWIVVDPKADPPAFLHNDKVQVKYRDGRIHGPEKEPWMFAGWTHDRIESKNDIVEYRVVK